MSRPATTQKTAKRSHGNSSFAAGGFAAPFMIAGNTNVPKSPTPCQAALVSQKNCLVSLAKTYTPFYFPLPRNIYESLRIASFSTPIEDSTNRKKSNPCHVTSSSREELTPSIVYTTQRSNIQESQASIAFHDNNTLDLEYFRPASDMAVGVKRILCHTCSCQYTVHPAWYDVPIGLSANLSILSPAIELEVNSTTTLLLPLPSPSSDVDTTPNEVAQFGRPPAQEDQEDQNMTIIATQVEETLIFVSRAAYYYTPTDDTFISSITMELTTQMEKNAETMRIKATPPPLVNYTAEHVASKIGGELPVHQPFFRGLLLEASTIEIKALVHRIKFLENPFKLKLNKSRPKPPPWPNKYTPDSTSTLTETLSAATPSANQARSSTISPMTSAPSESHSTTHARKYSMTATRTESPSTTHWHDQMRSLLQRQLNVKVPVLVSTPTVSPLANSSKYSTTTTPIHLTHRAERIIAHLSIDTSKPLIFSSTAANSGIETPEFEAFTCKIEEFRFSRE